MGKQQGILLYFPHNGKKLARKIQKLSMGICRIYKKKVSL
jgi:hypothetical protein